MFFHTIFRLSFPDNFEVRQYSSKGRATISTDGKYRFDSYYCP